MSDYFHGFVHATPVGFGIDVESRVATRHRCDGENCIEVFAKGPQTGLIAVIIRILRSIHILQQGFRADHEYVFRRVVLTKHVPRGINTGCLVLQLGFFLAGVAGVVAGVVAGFVGVTVVAGVVGVIGVAVTGVGVTGVAGVVGVTVVGVTGVAVIGVAVTGVATEDGIRVGVDVTVAVFDTRDLFLAVLYEFNLQHARDVQCMGIQGYS